MRDGRNREKESGYGQNNLRYSFVNKDKPTTHSNYKEITKVGSLVKKKKFA
jgi:hypothetical protein